MQPKSNLKRGAEFVATLTKCMELHKKHTDLVSEFLEQRKTLNEQEVESLKKLLSSVSLSQGIVIKALQTVMSEYYKVN